MYTFFNVVVHLSFVGLLIYALVPDQTYSRYNDLSLKKVATFAAFAIFGGWAFLVGIAQNFKSLFALIF